MSTPLDITRDVCPMTYVRVKLALEPLLEGDQLEIHLRGPEPLKNVPRSASEEGHQVLLLEPLSDGVWRLVLKKSGRS